MNTSNIAEQLHTIILDIVEEEMELDENRELVKGYGLDSMGYLSLSVEIQREFGVKIAKEDWSKLTNLSKLVDFVKENMTNEDAE